MFKDTLKRELNIWDIVCHANTSKYWGWAYVGRVIWFSSQKVRVHFIYWSESSCDSSRLAIMRSDDVVFDN